MSDESLVFSKKLLYLPLTTSLAFMLFTVLLFSFGPLDWGIVIPYYFYVLLGANAAMIWLGYVLGQRIKPRACAFECNWKLWFYILSFVYIAISIGLLFVRTKQNVDLLFSAFSNYGEAYMESRAVAARGNSIFEFLDLFLSPFTLLVLPLGFVLHKKLSCWGRILFYISMICSVLPSVATGTNFAVFELLIVLVWFMLIFKSHPEEKDAPKKKVRLKIVVAVILVAIILFKVFSGISGRFGDQGITFVWLENVGISVNTNWAPLSHFDEDTHDVLLLATFYVCNGYKGLCQSFALPWEPMYGIGNSRMLSGLAGALFGAHDFVDRSYTARLSEISNWDKEMFWTSIYAWIANDVSFLGVPAVMFLLGFALSVSWRDSLCCRNVFALAFFQLLIIAFFMFSMGNVIMQSSSRVLGFIVLLFFWLSTRKKDEDGVQIQ